VKPQQRLPGLFQGTFGGDSPTCRTPAKALKWRKKLSIRSLSITATFQAWFANIDKVLADNDINIRANYSRQIGKSGYAISVYVLHKKVDHKVLEVLKKIDNVCDVKV